MPEPLDNHLSTLARCRSPLWIIRETSLTRCCQASFACPPIILNDFLPLPLKLFSSAINCQKNVMNAVHSKLLKHAASTHCMKSLCFHFRPSLFFSFFHFFLTLFSLGSISRRPVLLRLGCSNYHNQLNLRLPQVLKWPESRGS